MSIGGAGVLTVQNNLSLANGTILSSTNGITIKNPTTTFLSIDNSGVVIIPTINSYQFFKGTNTNTQVNSTQQYFSAGVKCIHLSFSHATTIAQTTFTLLFKLQTPGAAPSTLYSSTNINYKLNSANVYQSQSFHFVTTNIDSQNIVARYEITGNGYIGSDGYITCIVYNLANNLNV